MLRLRRLGYKACKMKRLLLAASTGLALLAAGTGPALLAPPSALAYSNGVYTGTTAQGLPVSFKVKTVRHRVGPRGHRRVVNRRYVDRFSLSITATCPDGFGDRNTYPNRTDRRISSSGNFLYRLGPNSTPLKFRAHLTGNAGSSGATGTANDVTANRSHGGTCRSGTITWSAASGGTSPVGQEGSPPAAPTPPPPPDYIGILIGSWYQQIPPMSANLWFFNNNPTAGYRTGSRSFCPYSNNCGISPAPAAFIWYVKGDLLEIEFYGGITYTEYKIVGYNAATNTLTLSYNGVPTDLVRF
jgi:hypothetical protein